MAETRMDPVSTSTVCADGAPESRQPAAGPPGRRELTDRVVVKDQRDVLIVSVGDIDWIEAAGNYVKLHLADEVLRMRCTLGSLESRLDPRRFVRIHRSILVNGDRMKRITTWPHGGASVELADGTRLNLSRTYRATVDRFLGRFSP